METTLQSAIDSALQEPRWEEGDEDYDEDEFDAEAEEIAKRLGDQLWADIAKAQAEANAKSNAVHTTFVAAANSSVVTNEGGIPEPHGTGVSADHSHAVSNRRRKQEAALITVRTVLSFAFKDPVVRSTLAAHAVPSLGCSALDILTQCAASGKIAKSVAKPLTEAVVSLAKSDRLFSSMRNSDAAAIQLDKGKRKRDNADVDPSEDRYQKKPAVEYPDIIAQVTQAVRTILSSFSSQPPWVDGVPDPALISSLQFPLHQVYLFAVTSALRARVEQTSLLQELGALIQMLGVLSKIPIGPAPTPWDASETALPAPDIGTAVYPCLVPGCAKTFYRLYSLRTHQRLHALVDRPYKCTSCPASFQRNHDLKRHVKLHDKTAWKCLGCDKIFSRRDAIKRHKDSRSKGGKGQADSACGNAEIEQVEVEREEDEEDVTRRTKLWNGIVATQIANASVATAGVHGNTDNVSNMSSAVVHVEHTGAGPAEGAGTVEEGEVSQAIIEHAQGAVLQLYPVVKGRVGPSGISSVPPIQTSGDPYSMLSSVIARTQAQIQPPLSSLHDESLSIPLPPSIVTDQVVAGDATMSLPWLSEEQTRLLEQAIAQAANAAQAQAEAEAALEEEEDADEEGEDYDGMDATVP